MSSGNDQPDEAVGLGAHSARGLVYLFGSMTAMKLFSCAATVILGYLLSEADFGVVALAYPITTLIQVIEQAGVGDVLVQRKNFRAWVIPAFWLATCLSVVASLLVVAAAPIAAKMYGDQQLFWILLILAPSSIPNAFMAIPRAQMSRQLQFRALAMVNLVSLTVKLAMTIVLACIGFGAYSFVVPVPITNALTAAFLWWWVRPPWSLSPQLKRWRYLIGDSTRILVAEYQRAFIDQSDNFMLGLYCTIAEVGVYAFGYNFSIQILQLLAFNLMNVLFPAFTKLNDRPDAQYQGFMKAQRILAMVGVSSCLLQAATAAPLTYLLLANKWIPSIGVMQILCAGMALRMVAGSSYALLKSQGRFRAILWNRWLLVIMQVVGLWAVLSQGGGILSVALVVGLVSTIIGPISFYIAIRPYGAGWREIGKVVFLPAICGIASIGAAWLIALSMDTRGFGPFSQLIETVLVGVALNLLLAWLLMRPVWDDFWRRVWQLVPRWVVAKKAAAP